MERDPVCGMTVDPATAKHRTEHAGKPYYFCSARCLGKFVAEPGKYIAQSAGPSESHTHHDARATAAGTADAGAIYTCAMHPEIRQKGPGSCPICGMALEPLHVAAAETPSHELIDMTRRFWIGLVRTLPVFGLEMSGHFFGPSPFVGMNQPIWIQFALSTPVVLWAGWPFFQR
ncbi:MAG: YHS domain-containing protein, partial [Rhizomicrobium sp.]